MMVRSRISIAVLAAVCLAVSCSSPGGDPPDIETVEQLVDAHDLAWINNDPEGVGAFYNDDGVFVDLAGFETVGRQEIVTYAEGHVALIPESRRTGPVEVEADGTYVFPAYTS